MHMLCALVLHKAGFRTREERDQLFAMVKVGYSLANVEILKGVSFRCSYCRRVLGRASRHEHQLEARRAIHFYPPHVRLSLMFPCRLLWLQIEQGDYYKDRFLILYTLDDWVPAARCEGLFGRLMLGAFVYDSCEYL